jgi:hypothetical protein
VLLPTGISTLSKVEGYFEKVSGECRAKRGKKNMKFVEDLPMIIPGQFGFNCSSGFREEAFSTCNACHHMVYTGRPSMKV